MINNKYDLMFTYKILHQLQGDYDNHPYVQSLKRDIRNYYRRNEIDENVKIIKDNGNDAFVELRLLTGVESAEMADTVFKKLYYIDLKDGIGCTGKPFTAWYKIIQRNGKYYAYHAVNFDV